MQEHPVATLCEPLARTLISSQLTAIHGMGEGGMRVHVKGYGANNGRGKARQYRTLRIVSAAKQGIFYATDVHTADDRRIPGLAIKGFTDKTGPLPDDNDAYICLFDLTLSDCLALASSAMEYAFYVGLNKQLKLGTEDTKSQINKLTFMANIWTDGDSRADEAISFLERHYSGNAAIVTLLQKIKDTIQEPTAGSGNVVPFHRNEEA